MLQCPLKSSPTCEKRFACEYQWQKAEVLSMTFSREWAIHNLFLQGKSPMGEATESILHQRNSGPAAQPVARCNHSLGTPRRGNLKWPLSFLPLAPRAFSECQAAVVFIVTHTKLELSKSSLSLKYWFSVEGVNTWPAFFSHFLTLLSCSGELVWYHHM